jgi:glycosidase
MQEAMIFWLKETDIDGFSCDVAELVPLDFWVETRKKLQAIKPVFMLAEGSKEELFAAFDMTYNWQLTDLMIEANKFEKKSVQDIAIFRENFFKNYQPDWIVMNFTTNHDKNSWDFLEKDVFGNNRLNYAALTFLMNGMPLIYTGQESGLDKKVQFFEKDAVNWGNYKYQNFYQKLIKIYKNNPALWNGKFKGNFINYPQQNNKVLVFELYKDKNYVIAMQNYSDTSVAIPIKSLTKKVKFTDKISNRTIKNQKNYITIAAHSQYIFTN